MIVKKTLNLKALKQENPKFVSVKLVKSPISTMSRHKRTVRALGLRKLNAIVEHSFTPEIIGMLEQVGYLLEISSLAKTTKTKVSSTKKS